MEMNREMSVTDLVVEYWRSQHIKIMPKPIAEIERIQNDKKILLPADFKQFYSIVNGMPFILPFNETDDGGFLFHPLQDVISVENDFHNSTLKDKDQIFIFVDYMTRCWFYGYRYINDHEYEIGIIPHKNAFKVITNSLDEFLKLYLEDSPRLYDYS